MVVPRSTRRRCWTCCPWLLLSRPTVAFLALNHLVTLDSLQVLDLLPMADSVVKLTANCKFCKQVGKRLVAVVSEQRCSCPRCACRCCHFGDHWHAAALLPVAGPLPPLSLTCLSAHPCPPALCRSTSRCRLCSRFA